MDMLFSSNQHCQGLKFRQHAFRSSRWLRWGSLEMRIDGFVKATAKDLLGEEVFNIKLMLSWI